jgi:hypothetical protein
MVIDTVIAVTGTQLGYPRVSTAHQSLDQQLTLTEAGVDATRVYTTNCRHLYPRTAARPCRPSGLRQQGRRHRGGWHRPLGPQCCGGHDDDP